VRGDKERVVGLIDGHIAGHWDGPRSARGGGQRPQHPPGARGEQCDRAVLPAHVGHTRAGVHSQRDRGTLGPMTTDAATEPWSRVCTTMATKAAAPPFTMTAMRRLSMRLLRSGSGSGSPPRDPASRGLSRAAHRPRDPARRPG
jgi:hypothetical protein